MNAATYDPEPFDPRLIEAIEEEILATLEEAYNPESPKRLRISVEYALGGRDEKGVQLEREERRQVAGKRARPLLLLSSCLTVGGEESRAMPLAAAVELIHNFSLVHDDIEDSDEERRHRPSLWVVSGTPQAINTGSHMQALVISAALRLRSRGADEKTVLTAVESLTNAVLRLTEGQHLDIRLQEAGDVTLDGYWRMVKGKTASLLRTSCEMGAKSGGREDLVPVFGRYGEAFGYAFQARDDYLGIWGDPAVTGKPVGSDLLRRKKTLPVVYALTETTGSERRTLENLFAKTQINEEEAEEARAVLERLGAMEFTQKQVEILTDDAFDALEDITPASTETARKAYDHLVAITRFALYRNH